MKKEDYNHLYKITMKCFVFSLISICLSAYVKVSEQPSESLINISEILPKIILVIIPLELLGYIFFKKL